MHRYKGYSKIGFDCTSINTDQSGHISVKAECIDKRINFIKMIQSKESQATKIIKNLHTIATIYGIQLQPHAHVCVHDYFSQILRI